MDVGRQNMAFQVVPAFRSGHPPFVRFTPGAVPPVRVAPVVLPRSLLVTLPEVSTWATPRGFPGVFRCGVAGICFWERSVERIGNDVNKKRQGMAKFCIYIYGLFIEDVYIYHEPPKP